MQNGLLVFGLYWGDLFLFGTPLIYSRQNMRVPGREEFNTTVDRMLIGYCSGLPKRVKEKEELKEVDSKCVVDCVGLNTYMEMDRPPKNKNHYKR